MAKKNVVKVRMQSQGSHYYKTAVKNPKNNPGVKLQKKMYDPIIRKHVLFVEAKLAKAS